MAITVAKNSFLSFANIYQSGELTFFDTPDFPPIPENQADAYVQIDSRYLGRLDLLAFDYYGDAELWWVIALANNIDVIPTGMRIGETLRVPSKAVVNTYLSKGRNNK